MKALAIAASMLLTANAAEAKLVKPSGGSSSANLVISKVFYTGSKKLADNKAYNLNQYIELYNNSADTLDIAGVYIALLNTDNGTQAWTAAAMAEEHKDSIVVKQIFQIPAETPRALDPGASIVITNCAIDHSTTATGNVDLSKADYEVKSENNTYKNSHNDAVTELKVITKFGTVDFINFMAAGPNSIALLAADTNLGKCPKTFPKGKTSGNEYTIAPCFKTIDCVDIVKQKTPSADDKRIATNYDAAYTCIATAESNNGEAVVRKTAFVTSDGRTVLYDTNDSSRDFETTNDLALATYGSEAQGLTTQSITIPESGYLAINIDKPFCGPKDMFFCYVNASNNDATTDLKYTEIPGDSTLLIKGDWIAIAKPGTYNLKLSESQGVMKTRSSIQSWSEEDTKTMKQTNRRFYKFMNTTGKVGFQRVPATAEGNYNVADCSDGNRLVVTITDAIGARIFAANGAASWDELEFIPWHGATPEQAAASVQGITIQPVSNGAIYDLQGRRVVKPLKGIYVKDGKKMIIK